MTQREFIDKLKISLTDKVSTGTLQENINYYEHYFYEELQKGKREEEICASLGSPQLIAKGILEAEKFQCDHAAGGCQGDADEEMDCRSRAGRWSEHVRSFHVPGWLAFTVAVLVFFFVINLVLTVFSALAPIIIPVCIVLFIVQFFKSNF